MPETSEELVITDRRGWSIRKEINVGEIITTLVIFTTVMFYIARIDTGNQINARDIQALKEANARQDAERQLSDQRQREDYKALSEKMDKVLEALSANRR